MPTLFAGRSTRVTQESKLHSLSPLQLHIEKRVLKKHSKNLKCTLLLLFVKFTRASVKALFVTHTMVHAHSTLSNLLAHGKGSALCQQCTAKVSKTYWDIQLLVQ